MDDRPAIDPLNFETFYDREKAPPIMTEEGLSVLAASLKEYLVALEHSPYPWASKLLAPRLCPDNTVLCDVSVPSFFLQNSALGEPVVRSVEGNVNRFCVPSVVHEAESVARLDDDGPAEAGVALILAGGLENARNADLLLMLSEAARAVQQERHDPSILSLLDRWSGLRYEVERNRLVVQFLSIPRRLVSQLVREPTAATVDAESRRDRLLAGYLGKHFAAEVITSFSGAADVVPPRYAVATTGPEYLGCYKPEDVEVTWKQSDGVVAFTARSSARIAIANPRAVAVSICEEL